MEVRASGRLTLGDIHPLAAMSVKVHVAGQVIRFNKAMMDKYFDIKIQIQ